MLDARSVAWVVGQLERYSLSKTDKDVVGGLRYLPRPSYGRRENSTRVGPGEGVDAGAQRLGSAARSSPRSSPIRDALPGLGAAAGPGRGPVPSSGSVAAFLKATHVARHGSASRSRPLMLVLDPALSTPRWGSFNTVAREGSDAGHTAGRLKRAAPTGRDPGRASGSGMSYFTAEDIGHFISASGVEPPMQGLVTAYTILARVTRYS